MVPSLLFLPFPPRSLRPELLDIAYRPSIEAAINAVSNPSSGSILIIAVPHTVLHGVSLKHKQLSWAECQSLLATLYSIVSLACEYLSVPVEANGGPSSVDVRILLVDHARDSEPNISNAPKIQPSNTTVPDLATFVAGHYPWKHIFHADSEMGTMVFKRFCNLTEWKQKLPFSSLVQVPGGMVMHEDSRAGWEQGAVNSQIPGSHHRLIKGHRVVCLGGTFDYLHPGHKLLLTAGVQLLEVPEPNDRQSHCRFVIGITGDALLTNKKYADQVQSWRERTENVLDFLASILELSSRGWEGIPKPKVDGDVPKNDSSDGDGGRKAKATFRSGTIVIDCVEINDVYGPTVKDPEITALVVSGETKTGGDDVLAKRIENGLNPLELFMVDVLDSKRLVEGGKTEGFESKISSTTIRQRRAAQTNVAAARF